MAGEKKKKESSSLKTFLPYLYKFKVRILGAILFIIGSTICSVVGPYVIKSLIDMLVEFGPALPFTAFFTLVAIFFGLRAGGSVLDMARDYILARTVWVLKRLVALDVFEHLLALSADFHANRSTGGISRKIARGAQGIDSLFFMLTVNVVPTIFQILFVFSVFVATFPLIFGVVYLIVIIIYVAFTLIFTDRRQAVIAESNKLDDIAQGQSIDAILNYDTVKYFANEKFEYERYNKNLLTLQEVAIKSEKSGAHLNFGQAIIITIGLTILLGLSISEFLAGRATVGDFVLVTTYLTSIAMPLNFLGFMYRRIKESLANMDEMFALLYVKSSVVDKPDASELGVVTGEVRFDNVTFGYSDERTVLHNVSFTVPAYKRVAFVGYSGSGKSTITKLLLRLYDPVTGTVRVDGKNIHEVTQASLRSHIGVVAQDTILFNDTIKNNIAYGKPGASEAEIETAAKSANIHDFINKELPEKYETIVGERGVKLSGGEKQRVAIARMLLKNPMILIFDEATASLDSKAEKLIQEAIEKVSGEGGRTTIVIAHRLSTIVDFDKIIVLDQGKVVEEGTHDALLAKGGTYHKLWTIQHERKTE